MGPLGRLGRFFFCLLDASDLLIVGGDLLVDLLDDLAAKGESDLRDFLQPLIESDVLLLKLLDPGVRLFLADAARLLLAGRRTELAFNA